MTEQPSKIAESLATILDNLLEQFLSYLPNILIAITLLVSGWILAWVLRRVVIHTVSGLDRVWQQFVSNRDNHPLQPRHPPTRIVGELVFWLVLLIFFTLATDVLGLSTFGIWLKQIVAYLPFAIIGLFILLVGFILSSLVRDLVTSTSISAGVSHGEILGRVSQFVIVTIAVVLGVDQLGIDTAFLSVVAGITLAASLGGIALAFGLGARTHISSIIAANQLKQFYRIGDRVSMDGMEGIIIGFSLTRVFVETEQGTLDVPAKLFDEQVTCLTERSS